MIISNSLEKIEFVGFELIKLKLKDERILLQPIYQKLQASFLSTLFYCLGLCDDERDEIIVVKEEVMRPGSSKERQTVEKKHEEPKKEIAIVKHFQVPSLTSNMTKSEFLAQLPYFWIQKVLKSDCLCVKNEFERYKLAKKVLEITGTVIPIITPSDNVRKRKYKEEVDTERFDLDSNCTILDANCLEHDNDENIFESAIIYTYMSFEQLDTVKNDRLVPMNLALESYWLQNELSIQKHTSQLPKHRFSFKFKNISSNEKDIMSPTFNCLSQLFRLMLTRENNGYKALLQKSKGGSTISYCIYRIDLRGKQVEGTDSPVTYCTADDDGYANLIEDSNVLDGGEDSLWLVACIRFNNK